MLLRIEESIYLAIILVSNIVSYIFFCEHVTSYWLGVCHNERSYTVLNLKHIVDTLTHGVQNMECRL